MKTRIGIGTSLTRTHEKNFEKEASEWLEKHVRKKFKHVGVEDKMKKKGSSAMKKLKNWFCDSEDEEDISSEEDTTEGEEDWEEVDRKERNVKRKERRRLKKERLKAETSQKASKIVGIGPITRRSVDHFDKELKNFEKAKMAVLREFLQFYLNYDSDEIDDMGIEATQLAKDDILYIVIDDQSNIRELFGRIAQVQNNDIMTRNFIPPQFFERFMHINMRCKELRESNNSIKTQIRFGKHDIEVMTKIRGSDDPYKLTSLERNLSKGW